MRNILTGVGFIFLPIFWIVVICSFGYEHPKVIYREYIDYKNSGESWGYLD